MKTIYQYWVMTNRCKLCNTYIKDVGLLHNHYYTQHAKHVTQQDELSKIQCEEPLL